MQPDFINSKKTQRLKIDNKTISLKSVSKSFNKKDSHSKILEKISFDFKSGESYAIVGASGIGKSTLLHIISGIEQPSSGNIFLDKINLTKLPLENKNLLLQESIGILFQQPMLINELSIIENIILKSIIKGDVSSKSKEQAKKLLSEVSMLKKINDIPKELSGGEQQRIAILRAIFNKPTFLLADEPTGNLDKKTSEQITNLILNYQQKYKMGLIITTHDIDIAKKMNHIIEIKNKNLNKL